MWALPLITWGVGEFFKLFGANKAAKAAREAGQAEGERLDFNAQVADLQARDAVSRGEQAASVQRATTRQVIGTQRAGFAGQNVDVNVGSAIDVQADAALLGELDAQTLIQNAEREAWGYKVEASDRRMAADVARKGGASQASAIRWGALGSTLTGASSLLLQRYPIRPKEPKPAGA